jgi:periplasmic protein TonB
MEVSDVLRDRMHEPGGLQQMAVVSALLHAAAAAALILMPGALMSQDTAAPREVMTITLGGGTPGPETGGFTQVGGRAVQVQAPPEEIKKPESLRPPAAKTPEMTVPQRGARARSGAQVQQAPDEARGRTPTRGAETSAGPSLAETGVRGQGFGLAAGGGAGSGSRLDVADFCCPEYILLMIERIRGNWDKRVETPGETSIKFTILRDGTISGAEIERSSGQTTLDVNALRATVRTRQLPPLPQAFPNPTLTVYLNFQYTR